MFDLRLKIHKAVRPQIPLLGNRESSALLAHLTNFIPSFHHSYLARKSHSVCHKP